MKTIEESVERLEESWRKQRTALAEHLPAQPQTLHCEVHGYDRPLDEGKCSLWPGQLKLSYFPCPHCEEAERQRERDETFVRMGIPPLLMRATFGALEYEDAHDRENAQNCERWSKDPVGFLVLLGAVGTGKSHIGAAILRTVGRGLFITQSGLLRRLRESYRDRQAESVVEQCQYTPLLVLDEIGVSGGGRDEYPAIHAILDFRYAHCKPTVLTSNLDVDQFREQLGERLTDRIREAAPSFGILRFHGESKRRSVNADYSTKARQFSQLSARPAHRNRGPNI